MNQQPGLNVPNAPESPEAVGSPELTEGTNAQDSEVVDEKTPGPKTKLSSKFKPTNLKPSNLKGWVRRHPIRSKILAGLLLVVIVVLAVPLSRNMTLGLFIKNDVTVEVLDNSSGQPVSSADVAVNKKAYSTDKDGKAKIRLSLGKHHLDVTKKYYKAGGIDINVGLGNQKATTVKITATGRLVPVTVTNKISGEPASDVTVKTGETEDKTDKTGTVTVVLPADKTSLEATLSGKDFNDQKVTIKVSSDAIDNKFTITPSGKLYFLSKQSGKIDVVKTDLDGTNRKTVVAGTGKESDQETVLLASRDWKNLALIAKRDSAVAKLYLIETGSDKLSVIDEGDATFTPVGWYDNNFVYIVTRTKKDAYQAGYQGIKTFDATSKKIATIQENEGQFNSYYDYVSNSFTSVYVLNNEIVYGTYWTNSGPDDQEISSKTNNLYSVKPDGSGKKTVKAFPAINNYNSLQLQFYEPQALIIYTSISSNSTKSNKFKYKNGKVTSEGTVDNYDDAYNTYLISPSGKLTFWSDLRDGKYTLFLGDQNGENEKTLASLRELSAYGWYTDDYILLSKDSSELYIAAATTKELRTLKVSDYHKPDQSFAGYGYGYGGGF